jgi:hypothetical protein
MRLTTQSMMVGFDNFIQSSAGNHHHLVSGRLRYGTFTVVVCAHVRLAV